MNFNQLEYLVFLHQSGSFSQASKKLGITQPALSIQIQNLEEELGFKLIDRGKRPVALTAEGEIFFHKSVEIIKLTEQLKLISLEMSEEIKGELHVGIIPTLAPYLVAMFIGDLTKTYPGLHVNVIEIKTEEIIRELKAGNIDCGIISTPVEAAGVVFETLFYERFYAYVSEEFRLFDRQKIDVSELGDNEIWYLEEGNCFRNQINSICRISEKHLAAATFSYKSNSIESLRRIVENQGGVTFIPELATTGVSSSQEDLIREISGEQPVREISLVIPKNLAKERQVKAMKTVILRNIPGRMQVKPDSWIVDTELKIR